MKIDGYIEEVMESLPLQLLVRTDEGRVSVSLLEQTVVTRNEDALDHGVLTPGLRVSINGRRMPPDGMLADNIQILD